LLAAILAQRLLPFVTGRWRQRFSLAGPLKSDSGTRINVTRSTTTIATDTTIEVCPAAELGDGETILVEHDGQKIGVFNCAGTLYAIEDRCSHDDGPLAEGEFDAGACTVECPRHGSLFDLTTGRPKTLPAYAPVETFPVSVEDETIILEVD
jgi:3-phenylpropionate/trans-cinnamate dioxygenase ferredoxin component